MVVFIITATIVEWISTTVRVYPKGLAVWVFKTNRPNPRESWIPDSTLWIPDSMPVDSGFHISGFQIP